LSLMHHWIRLLREKLFDYLEANGCDPWLDTQKLAAGVVLQLWNRMQLGAITK